MLASNRTKRKGTLLKGNIFFVRKTSYEPYTKNVALYLRLAGDVLTPAIQLCSKTKCLKM